LSLLLESVTLKNTGLPTDVRRRARAVRFRDFPVPVAETRGVTAVTPRVSATGTGKSVF